MKTLTAILSAMLIAAALALASPVDAAKPMSAGLPLPTVSLNKAGPEGHGPYPCSGGMDRPRMSGPNLVTDSTVNCQDWGLYKVVSVRVARRLYARRDASRPWHEYSDHQTVASRMWEGPVAVNLRDNCNYGDGWFEYQVRQDTRIVWSRPTVGDSGVTHLHKHSTSDRTFNCGPVK